MVSPKSALTWDELEAAQTGNLTALTLLIEATPQLLQKREAEEGGSLLTIATIHGRQAAVLLLLSHGAEVDAPDLNGNTPLLLAALRGHVEVLRTLCDAGAVLDRENRFGQTALLEATKQGHIECVKLLSSYGSPRQGQFAENFRVVLRELCLLMDKGVHKELAAWLQHSRSWTPLHHIEQLTRARAVALLRGGASVHAGSPSPLERAREVVGEVGELVVRAAGPWSPESHELYPAAARERAVAVLRLGYLLAWAPQEDQTCKGSALVDAWRGHVLPHVVERGTVGHGSAPVSSPSSSSAACAGVAVRPCVRHVLQWYE